MPHVYRVTEVVGSSAESIEDVIRQAVSRASRTLRNLDWFEATEVRGQIEGDAVAHFQATVKIGFRLDDAD